MGKVLPWIVDIILLGLVLFAINLLVNYVNQFKRLKRRYDNLLRGRGNLNMEQFLSAHSEDIEQNQRKIIQLERSLDEINANLGIDEGAKERNFQDIYNRIDKDYQIQFTTLSKNNENRIRQLETSLGGGLDSLSKSLNENVTRIDNNHQKEVNRLDTLVSKGLGSLTDRLDKEVNVINANISNSFERVKRENEKNIEDINASLSKKMSNLEMTTKDELAKFDQNTKNRLESQSSKVDSSLEDTSKDLEKKLKMLDDKLNNATQKVAIHRYDAFDNLSNKLSYSLVMLDDHNDGFILTSIFGRNGSSMYAKEIKAGKSETSLSPEEEIALNKTREKRIR